MSVFFQTNGKLGDGGISAHILSTYTKSGKGFWRNFRILLVYLGNYIQNWVASPPKQSTFWFVFQVLNVVKTFFSVLSRVFSIMAQFFVTSSGFWMVNIRFLKLDSSSSKETKMTKTRIFWWKTTKTAKKVCKNEIVFFTLISPFWPEI